ncbi:MFS transporter [Rubeoparvulum massiliense]|uniref:MFS transporter n=1 Tax=Rubeoparvulum massiliense TaxID=1631346 RepID=UPI00065E91E1|nr:MFS transporter [Rubeoparvulum massiliense]
MTKQQRIGFIIVVLSLFLDMLLYSLIIPIIPTYAVQLGASDSMLGFLFSMYAIGLIVGTPLIGYLTERKGRKLPILIGTLGLILATLDFALADTLSRLMWARFFQGIAASAPWTAGLALLADLFKENRGKVMGYAVTGYSIGTLLGAPLGGVLYQWGGHLTPFILVIALAAINFCLIAIFLREPQHDNQPHKSVGFYLKQPGILFTSMVVILIGSTMTVVEPMYPPFLEHELGATPALIGFIFGMSTLGHIISSPVAGILTDRFNARINMLGGLVGLGISLVMLAFVGSIWTSTLVMFIFGFSLGYAIAPTLPELARVMDLHGNTNYGFVYTIFNLAFGVAIIIGPILGGFLTDWFGLHRALIYISVTLFLVTAILFIQWFKKEPTPIQYLASNKNNL